MFFLNFREVDLQLRKFYFLEILSLLQFFRNLTILFGTFLIDPYYSTQKLHYPYSILLFSAKILKKFQA